MSVTTFRLAQKLLTWLLASWNEDFVSLPDIYQKGPNSIRDKITAARLVAILEDHGWLNREKSGAEIAGQHRRDAWRIMGRAMTAFKKFDPRGVPRTRTARSRQHFNDFSNFSRPASEK